MTIVRIKGSARISWAHELVEDKDSGDFYLKVYPKLSGIKVARDKDHIRQVAKEVLAETKRSVNKFGKVKVK